MSATFEGPAEWSSREAVVIASTSPPGISASKCFNDVVSEWQLVSSSRGNEPVSSAYFLTVHSAIRVTSSYIF